MQSQPDGRPDWRLCIHGQLVAIDLRVPELSAAMQQLLGAFKVTDTPEGFSTIEGVVLPYDPGLVLRHVSPTARYVAHLDGVVEAYEDDDRVWIIDERWGLCEINFMRGQFCAWLLPNPAIDAVRCVEHAILWPLAQLMRGRGIHLLPAASVAKENYGTLLISSFNIEPELSALVNCGYQVVGQRWTALRLEEGRVAMLAMPGCVEQAPEPRRFDLFPAEKSPWINLAIDPSMCRFHSFCDTVLLIEPGRRSLADIEPLSKMTASSSLRRRWPMPDVQSERRLTLPWIAQMCHSTQVCATQLARDPIRLVKLLEHHRLSLANAPASLQATIHVRSPEKSPRPLAI